MTIALFLHRRRRLLALCAASALLHYLAIGWVGTHLGGAAAPQRDALPVSAALFAALLPPAEPAAPVEAPAPVAAVPEPLVKPVVKPVPPTAAPATAGEPPAAPSGDAAPGEGDEAGALAVAAESAQSVAEPAEPARSLPASPPEPPAPAAEPQPVPAPATGQEPAGGAAPAVFRASLPPSATLTLDVTRADADGTRWSGSADMVWKRTGSSYSLSVEAGVSMVFVRVNLAVLTSEGTIDANGIAPRKATEKRRGRAQTATHFDVQNGRITFSASEHSVELLRGAQDKASFIMQLAGIARADSSQFGEGIEMLVGDDRGASTYRFVVIGQEEIDTPMGRMATWHLLRPARPGAYNSRVDIWLAPQHNWYPVQIRNTESSGAVTTQTIRRIVVTESDKS